jgi:hypothetical protein
VAVIALAVDPAGQAYGLPDIGSAELPAIMGTIGVHLHLSNRHPRASGDPARKWTRFPLSRE